MRPMSGGLRAAALGGTKFNPISLEPVAWWRLDDGSGTTAVDSSGRGYSLTLTNTPAWISGQVSNGLNFVAASLQKGETAAAGLLSSLQSLSAFSVVFWARAAAYQESGVAFAIRNGVDTAALFAMYPFDINGGNGARVFLNNNSIINQNTGAAAVDTWTHFAFVARSATDHELFVNNVSVGTDATSLSLSGTLSHVDVGAWNGGQNFSGDIDEVLVFDKALTAANLTSLYNWR